MSYLPTPDQLKTGADLDSGEGGGGGGVLAPKNKHIFNIGCTSNYI